MGAPRTRFSFHFDPPLKEFDFAVDRFAQDLDDFRELFRTLSGVFTKEMGEQFESEGAPIGVRTGDLRSGMTGGKGYLEHIEAKRAEFGLDTRSEAAEYGPYFADRRPVVRMTAAWGRDWQKATHRWLVDVSAKDWGGALPKGVRTGGAGYQSEMLRNVDL